MRQIYLVGLLILLNTVQAIIDPTITIINHTDGEFALQYFSAQWYDFDPKPNVLPPQQNQQPGTITTTVPNPPFGVIHFYGKNERFKAVYFSLVVKETLPNRTQMVGCYDQNSEYRGTFGLQCNMTRSNNNIEVTITAVPKFQNNAP